MSGGYVYVQSLIQKKKKRKDDIASRCVPKIPLPKYHEPVFQHVVLFDESLFAQQCYHSETIRTCVLRQLQPPSHSLSDGH